MHFALYVVHASENCKLFIIGFFCELHTEAIGKVFAQIAKEHANAKVFHHKQFALYGFINSY